MLQLHLPTHLAQEYKSRPQGARVITESWVVDNLYCPYCTAELLPHPANTKTTDCFCDSCGAEFQIKSMAKNFGRTLLGAEYQTTLASVQAGKHPSLILVHYSGAYVVDVQLIHQAWITSSCIIPRSPLKPPARRAGWQGCTFDLSRIPQMAKVDVVKNSVVQNQESVLVHWQVAQQFSTRKVDSRSWTADVLHVVERLPDKFKLEEVYRFEGELARLYPNNHFIPDKIRQQLQVLRDMNIIRFVSRGEYLKIRQA